MAIVKQITSQRISNSPVHSNKNTYPILQAQVAILSMGWMMQLMAGQILFRVAIYRGHQHNDVRIQAKKSLKIQLSLYVRQKPFHFPAQDITMLVIRNMATTVEASILVSQNPLQSGRLLIEDQTIDFQVTISTIARVRLATKANRTEIHKTGET